MSNENPFAVTKAVDYTDNQIAQNFVSFENIAGRPSVIADPKNPMPLFLVGGKGGGRTHLMRRMSYSLQKLDATTNILTKIRHDGYVGVYFRCSGLNANRFAGKGVDTSTWNALFAYYMDLWLTQLTLEVAVDICESEGVDWHQADIATFVQSVMDLFDTPPEMSVPITTAGIADLHNVVSRLLRELDRSINNVALTGRLEPVIRSSPGRLVFGVSKSLATALPGMEGIFVTLLVDEFENLNIDQQRYLNTLIREREAPANFIVGSRRWGLRTFETLSGGEINKQDNEFELTVMEDAYAANKKSFKSFCEDLVLKRLQVSGTFRNATSVVDLFDDLSSDKFFDLECKALVGSSPSCDRKHMSSLYDKVFDATGNKDLAMNIVSELEFSQHPLLEKLAILKFYQMWNKSAGPNLASAAAASSLVASLLTKRPQKEAATLLGHWKLDMLAQLYVENDRKLPYYGFEHFIEMSGYLPRNLLIILKAITRWSIFLGESPFSAGTPISAKAQSEGVREAAAWYARDAKPVGDLGRNVDAAIRKLGGLMRRMRYSDKPVEVSCVTFSTDRHGLSKDGELCLDACIQHGLLLEIRDGQPDRNSGSLQHRYQLNPMLAPLYDLPTARRGTFTLQGDELRAIFDPSVNHSDFDRIVSPRIKRMNAPFTDFDENQEVLF